MTKYPISEYHPAMQPTLNLSPSLGHLELMNSVNKQLAYVTGRFGPWQQKIRTKLKSLLLLPPNRHEPLHVRSLWKREREFGTIEKIAFRAEAGVDVPGYWCVPAKPIKPGLTFICLQGHSTGMHLSIAVDAATETQPFPVVGDRDFAIGCMKRGIAALCIEQRSFGQRVEKLQEQKFSGFCHDAVGRALLLGRTLAGERVFDIDRALDYLDWRGDVNMKRVGIMGQSTGGTISMYAAALLPRVAYCMPSCSTARFADSIATIYHCSCNFVPGIMQWMDMGDILGAIAPRPLVIVNGKTDEIFPINSAGASFKQTKRIYQSARAANRVKFVEGAEGHRFYAEPAWNAMLKLIPRS